MSQTFRFMLLIAFLLFLGWLVDWLGEHYDIG